MTQPAPTHIRGASSSREGSCVADEGALTLNDLEAVSTVALIAELADTEDAARAIRTVVTLDGEAHLKDVLDRQRTIVRELGRRAKAHAMGVPPGGVRRVLPDASIDYGVVVRSDDVEG